MSRRMERVRAAVHAPIPKNVAPFRLMISFAFLQQSSEIVFLTSGVSSGKCTRGIPPTVPAMLMYVCTSAFVLADTWEI